VPAIYSIREFAAAGGLMSYGGNVAEVYRRSGVYAGGILKGEKPGDVPIRSPALVLGRTSADRYYTIR
jgi:putative tryptophan/tyrosine transport system substrate-binding protein